MIRRKWKNIGKVKKKEERGERYLQEERKITEGESEQEERGKEE